MERNHREESKILFKRSIYIYSVDAVCVTAVPKWMVYLADILVKHWVLWKATV